MIILFQNYMDLGKVKRKTPDPEEAKSLLVQSLDRLKYIEKQKIDASTVKFIFENAYNAIRESAQSLMSKKGFKPYSHEATISFIKQFYPTNFDEEEINKFDHFRKMRDDLEYRAITITEADAKSSLIFAKKFVKKIQLIAKE